MTELWDFIKAATVADFGQIPLLHTTDMHAFRTIRLGDILEPQNCDVFRGESLLYFFYGRPAYRIHRDVGSTTAKHYAPICVIMNGTFSPAPKRIFPFDTGAYHRKLLHPPMHEDLPMEAYELDVGCDAPQKLIRIFYGSFRNYYDRRPLANVLDENTAWQNLTVDAYYQLISRRSNSLSDDRASAIEIQVDSPVYLCGNVGAIIIPSGYLDQPGVLNQIDNWGAKAIPYDLGFEFVPGEQIGIFVQKVRDYLLEEGYLS
jgi:hypothetical protein